MCDCSELKTHGCVRVRKSERHIKQMMRRMESCVQDRTCKILQGAVCFFQNRVAFV